MAKQYVIVYLDTDANGDDLLDNAGNPIRAGWYRYVWSLQGDGMDPDGPFDSELAASRCNCRILPNGQIGGLVMARILNPAYYATKNPDVQPVTRENIDVLLDHGMLYAVMNRPLADGSPRLWRMRRNGATKRWKRDPNRIRIPFRYGFKGYGQITEADFVED